MAAKVAFLFIVACAAVQSAPHADNGLHSIKKHDQDLPALTEPLYAHPNEFRNYVGYYPTYPSYTYPAYTYPTYTYPAYTYPTYPAYPTYWQQPIYGSYYLRGLNNDNKKKDGYQTPLFKVPNLAIDQAQDFFDNAISKVGDAVDKTYDSMHNLAQNSLTTFQKAGAQGVQDGMEIIKSGLEVASAFPKIGLGLLTRSEKEE